MSQNKDRRLLAAKMNVISSGEPIKYILENRNEIPNDIYKRLIKDIGLDNFDLDAVAKPVDYKSLEPKYTPQYATKENEIKWCTSYLSYFDDLLTHFIDAREDFNYNILLGNYNIAEDILDGLQNSFGFSLWGIKSRLLLYQEKKGLEKQKELSKHIREKALDKSFVQAISYYNSLKNEPNVSPGGFSQEMDDLDKEQEIPNSVAIYLKYHAITSFVPSLNDLNLVLATEAASSVIDLYESLIYYTRWIVGKKSENDYPFMSIAIKKVGAHEWDNRARTLLAQMGDKSVLPLDNVYNCPYSYEYLLKKGNIASIHAFIDNLKDNPSQFDLIEILALLTDGKSSGYKFLKQRVEESSIPDSAPLKEIMLNSAGLLQKNRAALESGYDLYKMAQRFSHMHWADRLVDLIRRELPTTAPNIGGSYARYALAGGSTIHPSQIRYLSELTSLDESFYVNVTDYISDKDYPCVSAYSGYLLDLYHENERVRPEAIIDGETILARAQTDIRRTGSCRSQDIDSLLNIDSGYYSEKAKRLKALSLLNSGRNQEAVRYSANTYTENAFLYTILPLRQILESIDQQTEEWRSLCADLSMPVFLGMCDNHTSIQIEQEIRYALDDAVRYNNADYPSELIDDGDIPHDIKIYNFLSDVCTESRLDVLLSLESSEAVARERLKICQFLISREYKKEKHEEEVRDIYRRILIKKRMREVEKSKIYIDIEGVRKSISKDNEEKFKRYKDFINSGIDEDTMEVRNKAKQKVQEGGRKILNLSLPTNEMNRLLESIVSSIRDEFALNDKHGLDAYVSVRIRHGTFSGQIRSPLRERSLITQQTDKGYYRENKYWLDKLSIPQGEKGEALKVFDEFAKKFDRFLKEVKDTWLQVKLRPEDNGMFNFILLKPEIAYLSSTIDNESKYDDFFDTVVDLLYERLDHSLDEISNRFENEAKNRVDSMLNKLSEDITSLSMRDEPEFVDEINSARSELKGSLDRVSEWFDLSQTTSNDPCSIEDAISVAVNSIQLAYDDFEVDIQHDYPTELLLAVGPKLPTFVDIMFNLFENVVQHSGLEQPEATVTINAQGGATADISAVSLRIENSLAENQITSVDLNQIEEIRESVTTGKVGPAVSQEGGTGLLKVRKMLSHDLGADNELSMDFGIIDDSVFFVEFDLPIKVNPETVSPSDILRTSL